MFNRLNTDQSVGHMTVQFVPLKVTTSGKQWQQWASKYPPKGRSIPIIYVIRADGKMIHGSSGSLPGPALGELMMTSLSQSGRIFAPKEVEQIKAAIKAIKEANEAGNTMAAAKALGTTAKLGTIGDLKSYSSLAGELNTLSKDMLAEAEKTIDEAKTELADPSTRFDGAMKLAGVKVAYARLPGLKAKITAAYKEAEENAEAKDALRKAGMIQQALYRRTFPGGDKTAVRSLTRLVEQNPGTQAAQRAAACIEEITGEPLEVGRPAGADGFRTWTDATGNHQLEAKLLARKGGWVQLETRDGKKISMRISKLSPADQAVIEKSN